MFSFFDLSGVWDFPTIAAAVLGCAMVGGARCCGSNNGGCCDHDHEEDEDESAYSEMESQIEELKEKFEAGDTAIRRELADAILALAVQLQQDDFLDESATMYEDAIEHFKALAEENPQDTDLTRLVGLSHLSHAVALNDLDEKEDAIEEYGKALTTLTPLATAGDGEAKYDIAGIKLNQGTIYHELGELDKADKLLDEAFMEFRALEKISELDTRFYMGKVSVAIGNLLRDQDAPIEKIVEMYNRAMRLFVELIDAGEMAHELDLANVLIDKCMARFDAGQGEAVLVDMQRAIEILEKLVKEENYEAYHDLFGAMMAYGDMLLNLDKFNDALSVLNETAQKYGEWEHADDPMLFNEFAGLFERRGLCFFNLQKPDEAIADLTKSVDLKEKLWEDEWSLEDDILAHFAPSLVSSYCNRAVVYDSLGKKDQAMDDCKKAANVLEPYQDDLGEDYQELCAQIEEIRNA